MTMDKSAPRFQAGSMSLPEGAGEITAVFSCDDFLEIYTEKETYRVKSPEAVDPEITNPNAPWVSSKSSDYGSSNYIVARVLLQGSDMIHAGGVSIPEDIKSVILRQIHTCKESLLTCETVRQRVTQSALEIIDGISKNGVDIEHGRHVKNLPQVPNLEEDAGIFLINIKRVIVSVCYLASYFIPLPKKDNNLEYLKKSIEKLNCEKYQNLLNSLQEFIPGTKHLIELRNFQEHPGEKVTLIENFTITPKNEVRYPVWYLKGSKPESIVAAMKSAIDFTVALSETMLVHYLFASMESRFPYFLEVIPEDEVDPAKPIRHRISIDIGSLSRGK